MKLLCHFKIPVPQNHAGKLDQDIQNKIPLRNRFCHEESGRHGVIWCLHPQRQKKCRQKNIQKTFFIEKNHLEGTLCETVAFKSAYKWLNLYAGNGPDRHLLVPVKISYIGAILKD